MLQVECKREAYLISEFLNHSSIPQNVRIFLFVLYLHCSLVTYWWDVDETQLSFKVIGQFVTLFPATDPTIMVVYPFAADPFLLLVLSHLCLVLSWEPEVMKKGGESLMECNAWTTEHHC